MKLLKPEEVAKCLSVSRPKVLDWIFKGQLPCVILEEGPSGKRKMRRVKDTDLEKFVKERENRVKERNVKRLRLATSAGDDTKVGAA